MYCDKPLMRKAIVIATATAPADTLPECQSHTPTTAVDKVKNAFTAKVQVSSKVAKRICAWTVNINSSMLSLA